LEQGAGSFVAVIGEAGLGKSTLIAELKKSKEDPHSQWLRGEALSYTRSISYFPWRQILRQSIHAREVDSPAEVREKLRYRCDCCAVPGGDIPFLEAILAVENEAGFQVVTDVQGEALIQKMVDATRGYLCGIAMEGPLAIVLDDLHWADEASLNLLLSLSELADTHPVFFICMLRPDPTTPGWNFLQKIEGKLVGRFDSILLEPLQEEQTDVMLTNLLGVKDLQKPIRDLIVEKADGNPFFVEEIIRSLIETKQLVRENSHWTLMSDDAKVSLPNTLRGVLSARLDRLPETSKHILQNAAVIGRLFDLRVLKRMTNLNGDFDPQVQYLREVSLIEPAREEYMFRHVLIQEAAYESILLKKRIELHRQIGEIMEELHRDRIEEFAPLLAHHFYAAQDVRSLKYNIMAGEKAARLYANAEAATHFSRALEFAMRNDGDLQQIRVLFSELGRVLELAGRYEQALKTYNELQEFGRKRGDRSIEMAALMAKAPLYSIFTPLHNSSLSAQMLVQALEISREIEDRAAQARISWNLMLTYLFSKRLDLALEHGQLALRLARESDNREQLAYVLNDLCRLYTCRGEFEKAYAVIQEARELWRVLDNQVMLADSFGSEAEARFNAAEFDRSLECSRQALQITEKIENLWGQSYDQMLMAFVLFERGELGRGIQLAEQSLQLADRAGLIASSIGLRSELAWMYSYCGALEKGLNIVDQAFQVAETKQPAWKAFPQAAKVRMYLLQGDLKSAEKTAGNDLLKPISIPYARYTIFLCLANIELAIAKGRYAEALSLIEELLQEVVPLTRVDIPDVLRWKGEALLGLHRLEEAHQTLTKAWSLVQKPGAALHLLPLSISLAKVNSELGREKEAEDNRAEGRKLAAQMTESLREVGLAESFLDQPRVRNLMQT